MFRSAALAAEVCEVSRPSQTCGLVGGSRRLLNENLGRQIDSMDAVMRFNEAPTKVRSIALLRRQTVECPGSAAHGPSQGVLGTHLRARRLALLGREVVVQAYQH